jgi:hypothetical protein
MLRTKKKHVTIVCGLFVILILVILSISTPAKYSVCYENEYTGQNKCEPYHIGQFIVFEVLKLFTAYNGAITAISTGVIAWFTYALYQSGERMWRITNISAKASRRAANAAIKSADVAEQALTALERPYVFIDSISFPQAVNGQWRPSYSAKNYGKIPAIIRWFRVYAARKDIGSTAETQIHGIQIFNGQLVVGGGGRDTIDIQGAFTGVVIDPDRQSTIILRMEITYFDFFNYVHVAEFSFFDCQGTFVPMAGNPNDRQKSKKLRPGETWTPEMSKNLLADLSPY